MVRAHVHELTELGEPEITAEIVLYVLGHPAKAGPREPTGSRGQGQGAAGPARAPSPDPGPRDPRPPPRSADSAPSSTAPSERSPPLG